MKINYKFANGQRTEVEVSNETGTVIVDSRRAEHANNERHRYHAAFSIDAAEYEDKNYFSSGRGNPEDMLLRAEESQQLRLGLRQLTPTQRRRLLKFAAGKKIAEIAREEGDSFNSVKPVKGGTIVQMAKDRGWTPFADNDSAMSWDDTIEYDGQDGFNGFTAPDAWNPVQDLITYLELLFDEDDRVGYVTNDVWQDAEGKWLPSKGVYDRTAGELIKSLKKHPDDLSATIGDWKPQVGARIRFNPLDGDGVKNENVTKFRYALVESDTLPIAEQDIVFRKLELPIAALVHSGGKSLHAIVRVDAEDYGEYRKARTVNEESLKEIVLKAINSMILDANGYMEILQNNITAVIRQSAIADAEAIDRQLLELQQELLKKANNKEAYDEIADEIFRLRELKSKSESDSASRDEKLARITQLMDYLKTQPAEITEFDETLCRRLVQKITVYDDRFNVEFKSGVSIDIAD